MTEVTRTGVRDPSRYRAASIAVAVVACMAVCAPIVPGVVLLAFTPVALGVGWWCMRYAPGLYIQLSLWIVFLSPLVRRLVDYRLGYRAANPILLAPLLVPALTLSSLFAKLPTLRQRTNLPYALALLGVSYGFVVGVFKLGFAAAGYGFATWIVPLSFGYYLAQRWQEYPDSRRALAWTFVLSLLITGAYGVAQFVAPQPWDVYWIMNGGQSASLDFRPFHIRIFGPLNSFGPYAGVLMAGLIVTLSVELPIALRIVAGGVGLTALLMSQVRTCWTGLLVGVVLLITLSPGKKRLALIPLIVVPSLLIPLVLATPAAGVLRTRLGSFSSLSNDRSYVERGAHRDDAWRAILATPEGAGTGATGMAWVLTGSEQPLLIEQGAQDALYSLGWFGGIAYLAGVVALVVRVIGGGESRDDRFARACRCAALAIFATSLLGSVFVAVAGTLFWAFLGAHSAARRHVRDAQHALRAEFELVIPSALDSETDVFANSPTLSVR